MENQHPLPLGGQDDADEEEPHHLDQIDGEDSDTAAAAATFRPNLAGFTPTKIRLPDCDDESSYDSSSHDHDDDDNNNNKADPALVVQVNATNDFATTNYNERVFHWIDLHFLKEHLGQRKTELLLSDLEEPPSETLGGTYSECCNVLGTLYLPLSVSCKFDIDVTLMDPEAVGITSSPSSSVSTNNNNDKARGRNAPLLRKDPSGRTFTTTDAVASDDDSIWQRQQELLHDDENDDEEEDSTTALVRSSSTTSQQEEQQQQPLRLPPGWVNLLLSNVVVVDPLPVPFHISFRAIHLMPSIVSLSTLSPRRLFSPHYQQHPFWTAVAPQLKELRQNQVDPWESEFAQEQEAPQLVGLPPPPPPPPRGAGGKTKRSPQQQERPKRLTEIKGQTRITPSPLQTIPEVRKCACCFQLNPQVKCGGGCENIFYCDKICQSGHWKLHKKRCLNKFRSLSSSSSSSSRLSATSATASTRGNKQEQAIIGNDTKNKESENSSKKQRWWQKVA